MLIRSGDMKARTNERGQITINQKTSADTEMFTQTQLYDVIVLLQINIDDNCGAEKRRCLIGADDRITV